MLVQGYDVTFVFRTLHGDLDTDPLKPLNVHVPEMFRLRVCLAVICHGVTRASPRHERRRRVFAVRFYPQLTQPTDREEKRESNSGYLF